MKKPVIVLFSVLFSFIQISTIHAQPKYEFRAAWIATVVNIDWPSKKGLPVAIQKTEFIALLDSFQSLNINAVIVQIRPSADAFYPSPYEPWSEYLTGVQGQAPIPYYDPLKFMIEEAHKRNMEFHAWLNTYRAVFDINSSFIAPNNIVRTHKDWFLTYGTKKYFNPGLPEVMQYVTNVVKDIVTRYDIDAIHMDDYFYPYRIPGKEFPDAAAYRRYGAGMKKDDWRRSNCDSIIKMIHNMILDTKPLIKFGISPFGVWRNKDQDADGSNTHAGQTNYDDLYADILLWLDKGWIDYVAPQLYWEIGHGLCDYETLLAWWSSHSYGKHIYIGHGIYKAVDKPIPAWRNTNEIPNELKMLRADPNIQGSIYYSGMSLFHNPNGWGDSLKNNYYKTPALIPPMQWVDINAPHAPVITNFTEGKKNISNDFIFYAKASDSLETEEVKTYVVYISGNKDSLVATPFILIAAQGKKEFQFNISQQQIPADWEACYITITSVDRENNESSLSNIVQLIKTKKGWAIPK